MTSPLFRKNSILSKLRNDNLIESKLIHLKSLIRNYRIRLNFYFLMRFTLSEFNIAKKETPTSAKIANHISA